MLSRLKLGKAYDGMIYLYESKRNPKIIESHHHIEIELNLIVRGKITYVVDGRRSTFSPRTLLWLFPGQEHQLVDRSDDAQFYVAAFKPSLINRSCRTEGFEGLRYPKPDDGSTLNTLLKPESFDKIRETMDALMEGSLEPDLLNREIGYGPESDFRFEHHDPDSLNAGLHYLLLKCWRLQVKGESAADAKILHPAVRRAVKLLTESDAQQSLEELAKACGASKSYLSRTFHRQTGTPLSRYRNSLRLARFFEEYRRPEQRTLTEAMFAAGFGSYAQFYKVFTQIHGRGPREAMFPKP
jgi:AraC-like DNA-binding protein